MKIFATSTFAILVGCLQAIAQSSSVLKLNPANSHYLSYKNKSVILVGSGEHYGSAINQGFDYRIYLQTLAKDGLNITRVFTGAYIEKPGDFDIQNNVLAPLADKLLLPWARGSEPGFTLGGNKFDLTKWDTNYFTRLKNFISEAGRSDVIVEVNLFSSYYGNGWSYSALNTKNNINKTDSIKAILANTLQNGSVFSYQEKYVRKIVRELNGFDNLYYEIQNEPWADQTDTVLTHNEYGPSNDWRSTIQVVSGKSLEWQRQVANWIKDEENKLPNKHLISQNISNFHFPVVNADTNVSIYNFHYALPGAVAENFHLNRVIGFNETGFAGQGDETYRRQAWRFLMSGGGLFNHLDYSFHVGSENGQDTSYKAPGGGSPLLRKQLGILKTYFNKINFAALKPDNSLVLASPGATTKTLSHGKLNWVIYYEQMVPDGNKLAINLPAGKYKVEWTDVVTGHVIKSDLVSRGLITVPAGKRDMVVHINKQP